ncbi:hypothetical protein [Pedobacter cryoconitis]
MGSQDLNKISRNPYTKIEFTMKELDISRIIATRYFDQLTSTGFLHKEKLWKDNYYLNKSLLDFMADINAK